MGSTRRTYLALLMSTAFAIAVTTSPFTVQAKDGGGDDGGSGGGSSGSGSGGNDSSNSGHGGHDDGGGDDHGGHGRDDGGRDDNGGSGSSAYGNSDYDRARDAVRDGQIMSLKSMLKKIDVDRYGRIIDIRLSRSPVRDIYQLKLRDNKGVIRTLRVDAKSGVLIGSN